MYEYVVVIGIDGMGKYNAITETPNMDKLFCNGAETYEAFSMVPTISAQNWGAMLLGVAPTTHGLTNSIVSSKEYDNDDYPSLFKRIRASYPDAYLTSCCNWNPINHGIVDHDCGVDMATADDDEALTYNEILPRIAKKPKFLFIQFDNVDGAGHKYGYGTLGHIQQIEKTDEYVGEIAEAYKKAGIFDETLFIEIADHGGYNRGHGGYQDSEKFIYLGVSGKGVLNSRIEFAQTKDVTAIVLYALGIDIPEYEKSGFESQVPNGIFPDCKTEYHSIKAEPYYVETKPTPAIDGEKGLYSYIPKERVKLALFLDNNVEDATGKCKINEHGLVKYYSEGVYGSRGEFGATGCITTDDVKFRDKSFSFSAWLKIDHSITEYVGVCGTREWAGKDKSKGFIFILKSHDTFLCVGNGEEGIEYHIPFEEVSDGWVNVVVSFDKDNKQIRVYYNFKLANILKLDDKFLGDMDSYPFTVGNEAAIKQNNETFKLIFNMDDMFVFDGAFGDEEVSKLAEYYNF